MSDEQGQDVNDLKFDIIEGKGGTEEAIEPVPTLEQMHKFNLEVVGKILALQEDVRLLLSLLTQLADKQDYDLKRHQIGKGGVSLTWVSRGRVVL